jgi:gamma-glutamylcyclotransferase (GGCT)/AIG2-like uncharacterized protein YtfP
MPLYFAYGSNMDTAAMAARCPGSKPLGPARLPGHRLAIMREGWLTVVHDPRRSVWGMLWDLALADVPALDRYEDVAGGLYAKVQQSVLSEAGPRRALVYLGRNAGPGVPQPGYGEAVVAAARLAGLPADHLRALEALLPQTGRAGEPARPQPAATGVTPRRNSPLEREPDRSAGWSWEP